MWQIHENFYDYSRPNNKGYLVLNANQPLEPSIIDYPLIWSGKLNDKKVEIFLNKANSGSLDSYDFKKFPNEYSEVKSSIVKWIDTKLTTMD